MFRIAENSLSRNQGHRASVPREKGGGEGALLLRTTWGKIVEPSEKDETAGGPLGEEKKKLLAQRVLFARDERKPNKKPREKKRGRARSSGEVKKGERQKELGKGTRSSRNKSEKERKQARKRRARRRREGFCAALRKKRGRRLRIAKGVSVSEEGCCSPPPWRGGELYHHRMREEWTLAVGEKKRGRMRSRNHGARKSSLYTRPHEGENIRKHFQTEGESPARPRRFLCPGLDGLREKNRGRRSPKKRKEGDVTRTPGTVPGKRVLRGGRG